MVWWRGTVAALPDRCPRFTGDTMNLAELPRPRPLLPGEDPHRCSDVAAAINTDLSDAAEALHADLELLAGAADLTPAATAVAIEVQNTMHRLQQLAALLEHVAR